MLFSPHVRLVLPRCVAIFVATLLLCGLGAPSRGQVDTASVSGSVVDYTNAYVPGASIVLENTSTGTEQTTTTNKDGVFNLVGVLPGQYQLLVSAKSFADTTLQNIVLNVGDQRSIQIKLQAGNLAQAVTVNASGMTLNTTDASVGTVVDQKFVANMPLNGRSFQDLISMTPGVVTQSPQNNEQAVGASGDFSVNGQRTESNYYTVDGVTANTSGGNGGGAYGPSTGGTLGASTALGTTQSLISVDALQEFRVESSTYSAEYGHSPGGQFALVTRSGTSVPHGTIFDYLRNNFFDANDWFNDHYGNPQPALKQNDFGGTLGGPVRIPKLYNGKDRTFFFASYEGLRLDQPTEATLQYVPDLFMREQAAPAVQPILNAFPLPNGIDYGTSDNPDLAQFIEPYSLPSSIDSTSVRLDHVLSPRLSVFFRFGDTPSSTATRQDFALDSITSNAQTYTLGSTSQLSRRMTDEFRLGYARSGSSDIGVIDSFGGANPVNLGTAIGASSAVSTLPQIFIIIPGVGTAEIAPYYGSNLSRQWNLVDTFNLSFGRHALKFGIDYRHIKSPVTPAQDNSLTVWESATALITNATTISDNQNFKPATPLYNETSLFVQDDWRLRPNLNLSIGLRWEVDPPPTGQHGVDAYTLLGNIGDPASLSLAPQGTPLWRTYWYNVAPRLGLAWTPRNRPGAETVLRAGGGVFFDTANEIAAEGYSGLGFVSQQRFSGVALPYPPSELNTPFSTTPPYTSGIPIAFPSHLQLPYTLEWNTSIQQAVGKNQAFTISYVGSNGRRLLGLQELSLAALNPNFGTVEYFANGITSNYQALQTQFQRTVTRGIQALASYTWSHSIDFGSSVAELPLQRGNSDFDVRNNLQGGISWDVPEISRGKLVTTLSNGWGLDARLNARSGFPVTLEGNEIVDPATGSISFGELNVVTGKPIYVYGNQYPGGRVINKAAFSLPATGISGDAPRNFVRGFGATQLNMAVRREFHLHDALALQFRAEAFNILNHPIFGLIDPTYTDLTFGQATETLNSSLGTLTSQYQQGGPRSMQFALKLHF
jgi:Carboxypeptidase regulatory-like domain/TonB-dependent Receptor Plug Domain